SRVDRRCSCSPPASPRPPAPPLLAARRLGWLTILVLGCAVVVRLWRVWEWPPEGIGFEEFQIAARGLLTNNLLRNFVSSYSPPGEHALTAYAISASWAIFGPSFL